MHTEKSGGTSAPFHYLFRQHEVNGHPSQQNCGNYRGLLKEKPITQRGDKKVAIIRTSTLVSELVLLKAPLKAAEVAFCF